MSTWFTNHRTAQTTRGLRSRALSLGVTLGLLFAAVGPAQAQWERINVKLDWNGGQPYATGAGALGTVADQWNQLIANTTYSSIVDYNGAVCPAVSVQVSGGDENFGNGDYWTYNFYVTSASTPYYNLLRSYIRYADVYIRGLSPGAKYDLYIYFRNQNRTSTINVNGTQKTSIYTIDGNPLVSERDYLLFKAITADATGLIRSIARAATNVATAASRSGRRLRTRCPPRRTRRSRRA